MLEEDIATATTDRGPTTAVPPRGGVTIDDRRREDDHFCDSVGRPVARRNLVRARRVRQRERGARRPPG